MRFVRRYDSLSKEDLTRFLDLIPPTGRHRPRILEIGSASGNLSEALASREVSPVLVGLDVDPETLPTFRGFRVLADGAAPPFPSGAFDLVVFSSALHHVLRIDRTLSESVRLLRPGGRLVLFEPNARHPVRFRIGHPIFRLPALVRRLQGHLDPAFVPEDLSARLADLGLEEERLEYLVPRWPRPGWRGRLQSVARHLARGPARRVLSDWFLYVGRRP